MSKFDDRLDSAIESEIELAQQRIIQNEVVKSEKEACMKECALAVKELETEIQFLKVTIKKLEEGHS